MSLRHTIGRFFGFGPRWVPPIGNGKASDDWKRGDLAVCIVQGGGWRDYKTGSSVAGPSRDDVLRVRHVEFMAGHHMLSFRGDEAAYSAECFRKIRPDAREACKPAFAKQMRRLGRKVDA